MEQEARELRGQGDAPHGLSDTFHHMENSIRGTFIDLLEL